MPIPIYTLCTKCDHFVEPNDLEDIRKYGVAEYVHLDNGEKEHDHDAAPSAFEGPLDVWQRERPDLFLMHPDGNIGPNSPAHVHMSQPRPAALERGAIRL